MKKRAIAVVQGNKARKGMSRRRGMTKRKSKKEQKEVGRKLVATGRLLFFFFARCGEDRRVNDCVCEWSKQLLGYSSFLSSFFPSMTDKLPFPSDPLPFSEGERITLRPPILARSESERDRTRERERERERERDRKLAACLSKRVRSLK